MGSFLCALLNTISVLSKDFGRNSIQSKLLLNSSSLCPYRCSATMGRPTGRSVANSLEGKDRPQIIATDSCTSTAGGWHASDTTPPKTGATSIRMVRLQPCQRPRYDETLWEMQVLVCVLGTSYIHDTGNERKGDPWQDGRLSMQKDLLRLLLHFLGTLVLEGERLRPLAKESAGQTAWSVCC